VVAVASRAGFGATVRARTLGWTVAAAGVLLLGIVIRVAIGGTGVGNRSALVMTILVTAGVWIAARLLSGPRTALVFAAVLFALFDVASLPPRNAPEYDDLQAFYRTDQVLTAQLATGQATADPVLSVIAQPVFAGTQPSFGLAGELNGTHVAWNCPFERGVRHLSLALPHGLVQGSSSVSVALHLTGSPTREGDYLIVYMSSVRGAVTIANQPQAGATICSLA
jgi:hypothetical protein